MDPVTLGMANAAAKKKYAASTVGNFVPAGWGAAWVAKRDANTSSLARIAALGDSVTAGYFASSPAKGWSWVLRDMLQTRYSDGGSGFHCTADSRLVLTADGQPTSLADTWDATGKNFKTTGTGWNKVAFLDGPGFTPIIAQDTTCVATIQVRGSVIDVYYLMNIAGSGFGTLRVSIDGVAQTDIATTGTKGIGVTTYNVSAGAHTVVLTAPDAGTGTPTNKTYICGVRARNATGITLDRYAHGGHPSTAVNNVASATFTGPSSFAYGGSGSGSFGPGGKWSGGSLNPCDLAIYSFGLNDSRTLLAISPDTYRANIRSWLDDICTLATPPSILFLLHHPGTGVDDAKQIHIQNQHVRALAEQYGAGVVNMAPKYANSYAAGAARGYWGSQTSPGPAGADQVHLSDSGHAAVAQAVYDVLTV